VATGREPDNTLFLWSPSLNGNAKPSQILSGDATKLDNPRGLAFDKARELYALNDGYPNHRPDTVTIYARNASGNTAPIRMIDGFDTQIEQPTAMAVSGEMIYVFNQGIPFETRPHVTAYETSQTGDVPPTISISGENTQLSKAEGLAVDAAGFIYVNNGVNQILVFAPGATGDAAPVQVITSDIHFFEGQIAVR